MIREIKKELVEHFPFTIFGALSGVVLLILCRSIPHEVSHTIFYILHPFHVLLSALVTASIYSIYKCDGRCKRGMLFLLLVVGYIGSIGIATLSDSLIPFWGENLLGLHQTHVHIGFIEKWWVVNPLAFIGIAIAYFRPTTKFPHAGHVLISTWASLFHMLMAITTTVAWYTYVGIFFFLLLSVWLPCCISDIVFPLLFVKGGPKKICHQ